METLTLTLAICKQTYNILLLLSVSFCQGRSWTQILVGGEGDLPSLLDGPANHCIVLTKTTLN